MDPEELYLLAERLNLGILTVDKKLTLRNSNDGGKPFVEPILTELRRNCPEGYLSSESCKGLLSGDSIFCLPDREEGGGHILINLSSQEGNRDALLKESERIRRVLLDNMNSSFLIADKKGSVERAHFVGELSLLLGQRGYASSLDKIFDRDMSGKILSKMEGLGEVRSRDMSHFRFDIKGQLFWLDFYIVYLKGDQYFISIDDKTGEHYLLEKLDRLTAVEMSCHKVDELSEKTGNLVSGILGYAEMAINKNENPVVADLLDSIRKISSDGLNHIQVIRGYTAGQYKPPEVKLPSRTVVIDEGKALELLENNGELYDTVKKDFLNDYGHVPESLPPLYRENRRDAQILIHSIKGVAGIIGAYLLQDEANLLEGYMRKEEWEEAEGMLVKFTESLSLVIGELSAADRDAFSETAEAGQISLINLNDRQKDRLAVLLPLAESGDYNGLMTQLDQLASFEWGEEWARLVEVVRSYGEKIDFDGVISTVQGLI